MNNNEKKMNLYILNDVLYDYTSGMCVIAAESQEHCEQIFMEEFAVSEYSKKQRQDEFNDARFTVIENVQHSAGVVAYEYGGG